MKSLQLTQIPLKQLQQDEQSLSFIQQCKCCKKNIQRDRNILDDLYCQKCLLQIKKLKIQVKPQKKKIQSSIVGQDCTISMNPEFNLDLIFSQCRVCFKNKCLINICANNHYFCESCLQQYILNTYTRSLNCIDQNCKIQLNYQLVYFYLNEVQITKWKAYFDQISCINENCQQEWQVFPNKIKGCVEIISQDECICQVCKTIFCYKCRTIHRGKKCDEEKLLKIYLKENKCFRCSQCNVLQQPSFCHNNYDINKLVQWKENIYQCYICKKSFCYDCQEKSQVQLFNKLKCQHCATQYYRWKEEKIFWLKKFLFALLFIILVIPVSVHSTLCYGLMEVMDLVMPKLDSYCKSEDKRVQIIMCFCFPLIIIGMLVLYAILMIPLLFYFGYQFYRIRYLMIEEQN